MYLSLPLTTKVKNLFLICGWSSRLQILEIIMQTPYKVVWCQFWRQPMFIFILETYNIWAIGHGIFRRNPTPRRRSLETGRRTRGPTAAMSLSMNSVVVDSIPSPRSVYSVISYALRQVAMFCYRWHIISHAFSFSILLCAGTPCDVNCFLIRKCSLANCVLFFYTQVQ